MKKTCSPITSLSSRGPQTPRDRTPKYGASAIGEGSTTQSRGTFAGSKETDQSLRGPSPSARIGMTSVTA
jgi:hypothetical protein